MMLACPFCIDLQRVTFGLVFAPELTLQRRHHVRLVSLPGPPFPRSQVVDLEAHGQHQFRRWRRIPYVSLTTCGPLLCSGEGSGVSAGSSDDRLTPFPVRYAVATVPTSHAVIALSMASNDAAPPTTGGMIFTASPPSPDSYAFQSRMCGATRSYVRTSIACRSSICRRSITS